MKKILVGVLASLLLFSSVSAGEETSVDTSYKTPVIDNALNFEAKRDGNGVYLEWKAYTGDDFKYYKVMRSETHKSPVYPDQNALQFYDDQDTVTHDLKDWASREVHYRVCVITTDKSRICSNVVTLAGMTQEAIKSYQVKKYDYKKVDKKVVYKKTVNSVKKYEKKSQVNLDEKLQKRADQIVTKLIARLDNKYGTDNEAKAQKLSDLSAKLSKIKDRIKSEKTKALVAYLIEALDTKKAEYGSSDDIEEIFNLLGE